MSETLPLWLGWTVVAATVAGALLSLLGAVGLVRLGGFYERVHAPTLGATLGTVLIVLASVALASAQEGRPVLRDLLLIVFLNITTPGTLILLARAAVYRDRVEGVEGTPEEP